MRSPDGGSIRDGGVVRSRTPLPITDISGGSNDWKDTPTIKTRLTGGYCLRTPAQGACAYANICEHCPNFRTESTFLPILATQRADADARGWGAEATRHRRLVERLDQLINRTDTP